MIRVLVVDDEAVVRAGLRMIVEFQDDLEVVGEGADGAAAVELASVLDPDVVLLDIRMPGVDGIAATEQLVRRGSRPRVIVLTTYGLDDDVRAALAAGAHGFLLKTDEPEHLLHGIRTVAAGERLLGPTTTARLVEHFLDSSQEQAAVDAPELRFLTEREREVLEQLARGLSNAEIGRELHIGEGTVKTHVARILAKLGVRDRVQAAVFAHENGLGRSTH